MDSREPGWLRALLSRLAPLRRMYRHFGCSSGSNVDTSSRRSGMRDRSIDISAAMATRMSIDRPGTADQRLLVRRLVRLLVRRFVRRPIPPSRHGEAAVRAGRPREPARGGPRERAVVSDDDSANGALPPSRGDLSSYLAEPERVDGRARTPDGLGVGAVGIPLSEGVHRRILPATSSCAGRRRTVGGRRTRRAFGGQEAASAAGPADLSTLRWRWQLRCR